MARNDHLGPRPTQEYLEESRADMRREFDRGWNFERWLETDRKEEWIREQQAEEIEEKPWLCPLLHRRAQRDPEIGSERCFAEYGDLLLKASRQRGSLRAAIEDGAEQGDDKVAKQGEFDFD